MLLKHPLKIAIDGPAGSGKSTVAKEVAKVLGLFYLDTGAMYRAIAYIVLKNNVNIENENMVSELAEYTELKIEHSGTKSIWCDGQDVSDFIRSPEVSKAVSVIATYPRVRERLVFLQRLEAEHENVVMDGRDIGTHVLPLADLKIFLTGSPKERARRRWLELKLKGKTVSLEEVEQDMEKRDNLDMGREISPLKPSDDAVVIDSTGLNINEVVEQILVLISKKLG